MPVRPMRNPMCQCKDNIISEVLVCIILFFGLLMRRTYRGAKIGHAITFASVSVSNLHSTSVEDCKMTSASRKLKGFGGKRNAGEAKRAVIYRTKCICSPQFRWESFDDHFKSKFWLCHALKSNRLQNDKSQKTFWRQYFRYITDTFNTEEEKLDFQLMFEGAYDPAFPSSHCFVQN